MRMLRGCKGVYRRPDPVDVWTLMPRTGAAQCWNAARPADSEAMHKDSLLHAGPQTSPGRLHLSLSHAGLNTGSVIIRNSDWSRMLVEDMATYGKYPVDWAKEAILRAAVPTYDMGMYEQNVLIYRLTSDPSMMQRVRLPALVQTAACAAAHVHM